MTTAGICFELIVCFVGIVEDSVVGACVADGVVGLAGMLAIADSAGGKLLGV
tara:strand:+ start:251 stop:406 length:156 start_codon:yes stop_codon:yes gene_type:complete